MVERREHGEEFNFKKVVCFLKAGTDRSTGNIFRSFFKGSQRTALS
jgi:hypothetical protein